jgi:hypothetical protein
MHRLTALFLALLCFSLHADAQRIAFTHWAPDAATAAQIDSMIDITGTTRKLNEYDRYYAGVTADLKRAEVLYLLAEPGRKPAMHLVDKLPPYTPEDTCGYWNNYIDMDKPTTKKAVEGCKRIFVRVFLSRQPFWMPDIATVQAMEKDWALPSEKGFTPEPLETYARYYTGRTLDGHRVIEGKLLAPSYARDKAGIHLVDYDTMSQTVMIGGGCGYIMTLYDVDTKVFLRRECYGLG